MFHSLPWTLAATVPCLFSGARFHRAALAAAHRRELELAERLFERAAERYRAELRVEPLARLRVHQEVIRMRASERALADVTRCLEVDRALARLDEIESFEPPFELVGAESLLAAWHPGAASGEAARGERLAPAA